MYSIIVAVDKNNAIGTKGNLLCHLKGDMAHFKQLTINKTVIMGYRTFVSLGKTPLKHRRNIVLSHRFQIFPDVISAHSIDEVETILQELQLNDKENFIIGGSQIYRAFLPLCDRMYVTHIDNIWPNADTFFEPIDPLLWKVSSRQDNVKQQEDEYNYSFVQYERIK